jgi:hypothetical protein
VLATVHNLTELLGVFFNEYVWGFKLIPCYVLVALPVTVAYYSTYLPVQLMGASELGPKPVVNERQLSQYWVPT